MGHETMAELQVESDPIGLNLMRRHWPAIERVAEALLRQGRLSEAEVLILLGAQVLRRDNGAAGGTFDA